jgi:signal peptidase I
VTRGTASFFRDNLEAFAVAIAMALVLRHYCIEAFRIPTKSMMPSLLGDDSVRRRHGDRILVDKFVAMRRDPRRGEVWVFQYPLNRNRNYIKRVAGLPGEWLRIVDGDLWVSADEGATWAIQRRPPGIREQLFFPYYPRPVDRPEAFAGRENWEVGAGWRVSEREGIFKVDARGDGPATLQFGRQVLPYPDTDTNRSSRPYAGDVRVRVALAVERAGRLTVYLTEHGRKHRLVLGQDESYAVIVRKENRENRVPVDVRLEDDEELAVSFANVDDTLVIEIDGDMVEIPFPDPGTEPEEPRMYGDGVEWKHEIVFEAQALRATLADLRIDRDLYYNARKPDPRKIWKVPADHFLMLGDNTQSSKDGRLWNVNRAHCKNGEVVSWEGPENGGDVAGQPYGARPHEGEDPIQRVPADINGLVRYIDSREVERYESGVPHPFVSRDHMIGRAFAIFWPIHLGPLYKGPSRVNLIR